MAYSTSTPPTLLVGSLENSAPNIWAYKSADAVATVRVINYFTNAQALGMKVGDIVFVYNTNSGSPLMSICVVMAVASTGADLSDGTAITVTNTD